MTLMKKSVLGLLSAALVAGTLGTAYADNRDGGGKNMRGMMPKFEEVDANADGALTFEEFAAPLLQRFDEADKDANGSVNAEEIAAAVDSRRGERMAKRLIKRFDVDANGEVTKAELENRQRKMFALLDMDDSGQVSKDELPKRGERGGKRHGDRDRGNDN